MKWLKQGKIFEPTDYELPNGCTEYAQSPQVLAFRDYFRVYFCSRTKDATGKFLSHVCYADFTKDFRKVVNLSSSPVIPLGGMGDFDEHGIFPFNVVRDESSGNVLAYTTGWNRRASVSVDASIGLAVSQDQGCTFNKVGIGPVLSSSLYEPFLIGDAFVLVIDGRFHMWYINGIKWLQRSPEQVPDRVYKIAHAVSDNGIDWCREGRQIISDKLNPEECQALPTVFFYNGLYHMYFCYREAFDFRSNKSNSYRLGYAYSSDLVNWTRDDDQAGIDVSETGWDSEMLAYPHVFKDGDDIYMLYNGNQFGKNGFGLAILEK